MVKITVSEKRSLKSKEIEIGDNTTLKTWGTIKVNKSHFFPSSFQIKSGEKVIYIDPIEIDPSEKADYILITHSHPDHFSLTDIKKILKSDTKIICSKSVFKKLKGFNNSIHILGTGDTIKLEGLNLTATAAYNTKSVLLWIKAHPKSKGNIGFILSLDNGLRIYYAGDTDYISEMLDIKNIQLALIPIGGDNLTLNEVEAAMIVNQIKPKIAVPMHYEIKNRENLKKFRSLVDRAIQVIEFE
jgi:L-ascorbate metabolism protein UlaG (beta-lactamase superfamily)